MATAVMASALQRDLEKGLGPGATRTTGYIRDITYRVIPFCMAVLIIFSVGIIIVTTLHFDQPIPHQGTFVISILLAVLFFLFCIGVAYLYKKKHYPPLTKGPDAPDRLADKRRTWRCLFSKIGALFIDHLRGNKPLDNHENQPEPGTLGIPNDPFELESPNPASMPPPESQQPNEPHIMEQQSTFRPSHHTLTNKEPQSRKPLPQRRGQYHSPKRKSYTPSETSIPEEPEEDDPPVLSVTYMPPAQHPLITRATGAIGRDGDMVSPKSQYPSSSHNTGFSDRHLHVQTTSVNGNPRINQRGGQHPRLSPDPQPSTNRGMINNQPISSLRPEPGAYRLSTEEADPLAHFANIPESINEQAFDEAFPEDIGENGLYIFNNLPNLPNHELEAARFGGECHCYREKPKDRVHERKSKATQSQTDMPKRPPTHDSGYSEGILSFINASLARPTQVLYPQDPRARRPSMVATVHGVEDGLDNRDASNEKERPKGTNPPSIPRQVRTERQRHKPSERAHRPSSQQNGTQPRVPDFSEASLYPLPLNLPSAPPKTKPPSRKDLEIPDTLAEQGSGNRATPKTRGNRQAKNEAGEEPQDQKQDLQKPTWKKSSMTEETAAKVPTYKVTTLKPAKKTSLSVRDRRSSQMPRAVPPRTRSRFREHSTPSYETDSESSTSVSDPNGKT
ncbi:hypothetical protein F5Y06DRAFT_306638 [Hypoxylon sp. FL0890]|nr:hypothetical protein F5Y06DRAFT_306638 [Hypoxylon sp. FL0890]